jgi:hypothetical protein
MLVFHILARVLFIWVLLAAMAINAHSVQAEDRDDFFEGFPSIRVGMGGGGATMCDDSTCRDGHAVTGTGSVMPKRGIGGWVDMSLYFATSDICIGIGCGGLRSLVSLTTGIAHATERWHSGVGLGVAYVGDGFDELWKYADAIQATAMTGVTVGRIDQIEVAVQARAIMSVVPFGDIKAGMIVVTAGLP